MVYSILVNPVENVASWFLAFWDALPLPFKALVYLAFALSVVRIIASWISTS